MGMFKHLGLGLRVVRDWRGKSLGGLAREASVGKSQLSKYENGRELPKLDSLERVLVALAISAADFFLIVRVIERQLEQLDPAKPREESGQHEKYADAVARAFQQMSESVLDLHRVVVEEGVRRSLSLTNGE